ncbi:hypothetical protein AX774_g6074, partial [Zancudomyces culisetae]
SSGDHPLYESIAATLCINSITPVVAFFSCLAENGTCDVPAFDAPPAVTPNDACVPNPPVAPPPAAAPNPVLVLFAADPNIPPLVCVLLPPKSPPPPVFIPNPPVPPDPNIPCPVVAELLPNPVLVLACCCCCCPNPPLPNPALLAPKPVPPVAPPIVFVVLLAPKPPIFKYSPPR